jgi:hypothetical protein
MLDLHVGQKMVCVDMSHWPGDALHAREIMPREGEIYTIRAIVRAGSYMDCPRTDCSWLKSSMRS